MLYDTRGIIAKDFKSLKQPVCMIHRTGTVVIIGAKASFLAKAGYKTILYRS
jgi:hypothetical protein